MTALAAFGRMFAPELALALAAVLALADGALGAGRRGAWIALAGSAAAAWLVLAREPAAASLAEFAPDGFATCLELALCVGGIGVAVAWTSGARAPTSGACVALLCGVLGGCALVGARQATTLAFGAALVSLSGAALAAGEARTREEHAAARRLFLHGSAAAACACFGASLFLAFTGTQELACFGDAACAARCAEDPLPVALALALLSAGLVHPLLVPARRLPLVPAAYFATVAATACLGALLRVLAACCLRDGLPDTQREAAGAVGAMLAWAAGGTLACAALVALRGRGLRGVLAGLSTAALCGVLATSSAALLSSAPEARGEPGGTGETGVAAALALLVLLALVHAGLYAAAAHFEREAGSDRLEDLRGAGLGNPALGAALLVLLAAQCGLPPTIGAVAKFRVLLEAWHAGQPALAVLVVVAGLLGLACTLRIALVLFAPGERPTPARPARALTACVAAAALAALGLGAWPRALEVWTNAALEVLRAAR